MSRNRSWLDQRSAAARRCQPQIQYPTDAGLKCQIPTGTVQEVFLIAPDNAVAACVDQITGSHEQLRSSDGRNLRAAWPQFTERLRARAPMRPTPTRSEGFSPSRTSEHQPPSARSPMPVSATHLAARLRGSPRFGRNSNHCPPKVPEIRPKRPPDSTPSVRALDCPPLTLNSSRLRQNPRRPCANNHARQPHQCSNTSATSSVTKST